RGARCLCVNGQRQATSRGAAKNKCFHSFHLSMRCREKPVRIQKNDLVSSKFEGYAPSCLKIGARLKTQRVTRLELATSSLARRCSTTELHPRFTYEKRPHKKAEKYVCPAILSGIHSASDENTPEPER